MALTTRQKSAYRYVVDVYRQYRHSATGDMTYAKVLSSLRVGLFSTPNFDLPTSPVGLVKQDNILTSDILRTEVNVDLRGQDHIVIVAAIDDVSSPFIGEWFKVRGDGQRREIAGARRSNSARYFINFTGSPV